MLEDMKIRNFTEQTQKRYVEAVAAFARHFGASPERLGSEEVRAYQLHLIEKRQCSWSHVNVTVCALRFLYGVSLNCPWDVTRIRYPKREKRLPVVLSPGEVSLFFEAIRGLKYRAALEAAGIEPAALKTVQRDKSFRLSNLAHLPRVHGNPVQRICSRSADRESRVSA